MNMKRYVVRNGAGEFLILSNRWGREYPDALKWTTSYGAARAAIAAGGGQVVEDYGLETERVCMEATADGNIRPPPFK